jgi:pimeloyl-ACP methyl ester carboxylesterase
MYLFLLAILLLLFLFVSILFASKRIIEIREKYISPQIADEGNFVNVDGVNAHYIRKGSGKTVILIHGIFSSSFVWQKNIDALSWNFDVIALDLKGYGYSDKPADGRYSQQDMRDFILKFMDALHIEKAFLVGHSWGGGIAMDLTLHWPERIEKLILIDSTGYPTKASAIEWFLKYSAVMSCALAVLNKTAVGWILRNAVFFDPSLVTDKEIEGWMMPYSVKGSAQAAMELRKIDFVMEDEIKRISHPALIIWGRQDRLFPFEMASRFKEDIKNSATKIIENCGHNPQEEKPADVNKLIIAFLQNQNGLNKD